MRTNDLPLTNARTPMPKAETSNGRSCRSCSKANVCKYQEIVIEEVEILIGKVEKLELPLSININCREYLGNSTTIRGM